MGQAYDQGAGRDGNIKDAPALGSADGQMLIKNGSDFRSQPSGFGSRIVRW